MSAEYANQDPIKIAEQAERDLNSTAAKQGHSVHNEGGTGHRKYGDSGAAFGASDSTVESGVDQSVENKFPGSSVTYGSAASGQGDNREIPVSEGGSIDPVTGKPTKARDFEGMGGPEDKAAAYAEAQGGENDVRDNIRQGGETVRPAGSAPSYAAGGTGKQTGQESG